MQCAGPTVVALAGLALLLLVSSTPDNCEFVTPNPVHPNCTCLERKIIDRVGEAARRSVSRRGQALGVALYWGSEPAHAAAALLAALLRHVRRYERVRLAEGPHATTALANHVPFSPSAEYTDLVIAVSTAWKPEKARLWWPSMGAVSGLAGPRLSEFGLSPVTARRRLHAWLTPAARALGACHQYVRWTFYTNTTALALCGFVNAVNSQGKVSAVEVVGVGDCNATLQQFEKRAAVDAIPLRTRLVNRTVFVRTLQTANHSFLFIDYDIWKGETNVSVVEAPPCLSGESDCKRELDSAIAMRVADVEILQAYAPQLFQFVYDFYPTTESLRLILEREANGVDIEEAACEWLLKNKSNYAIKPQDLKKYDLANYTIATYLCSGDTNNNDYDNIIKHFVGPQILEQIFKNVCNVKFNRFYVNCSDDYHMSKRLDAYMKTAGAYRLMGVVSLAVEGAAVASGSAVAHSVPLLLASVVPEDASAAPDATWRVAGRPRHVARALRHFVLESGWKRIAVLSQPSKLATDYYAALKDKAEIILREFQIPLLLKELQAQVTQILQDLRATNARIVFVNADSKAAATILAAAVEGRMTYTDGFVWIIREWQLNNDTVCGTKHFTVSFWNWGEKGIPLHMTPGKEWPHRPFPPHAVSLADALLTLARGLKDVFQRYPSTRQDLRSPQVIRSLTESLSKTPVTGVNQLLRYKERSIEETFVFVDQWCGGDFKQRLATWRVNATSGDVRGESDAQANYTRPADMPRDDGTSSCIVRSGDEFDPNCYDTACACASLLVALAPVTLLLVHRALRRRLARLQQEQQIQVIARRRHVATGLAAYLVERDMLELHEELGAGRFGSVRLARLRVPAYNPRYIAAKALRENAAPAEESEFLREACTIASLDHAHIVRLVGVCIADGPPLVLMELAFFGDLLGYLRARRHLVEGVESEVIAASGEAEHVSAEALTRLAREAAEALQYLGVRGVVHRDVRAANCLVDVRRSLKLADFGMARDTVAGTDGAPEYACRRRGLFPVLWMAPESLAHGVFSAASDVWAFGVLMLELVTLGARPYGVMSPLRVLEYVAAGGSPPLPLDATPQTRGLARLCWQRTAERRPSAAEVAAYLAARPLALRPALLSERDEPADADSGFGESPSTELLPPDSPLHSPDHLEVLAATH